MSTSQKQPASLKSVAKMAGVSIATVSRVLNGDPVVKPETKLAVEKAIKTSGYHPNRVAQRLRSSYKSGRLIGLVIPDIRNPYYIDVIRGIEESAYANGSAVLIGNFSQDPEKEKMYINILKSESVDGFIIAPHHGHDKYVEDLIEQTHAVVCIDRGLANCSTDVVKSDNERGAFNAVEHLIKLGHKRIAHITGNLSIPTTHERIAGYVAALRKYDLPVDDTLIRGRASDFQSGIDITAELLDLPEPPEAIFTANNLLTLGSLEKIHERGVRIPDEIAIVGFDDMYWAASLNPALTAVRQHGFEIGKRAIELLYQRIEDPARPAANIIINTDLMVRRSCGFKPGTL
ncbi:LacI family DNA-binding transcriptional regulator [Niastella yeongjuensis]|nr:LacI family DNA-binding transcriptional regulator [Niastella yeongjuensis]SEP42618.1 transcriptional regulator, LacI family [Niastella yeongjuensis]